MKNSKEVKNFLMRLHAYFWTVTLIGLFRGCLFETDIPDTSNGAYTETSIATHGAEGGGGGDGPNQPIDSVTMATESWVTGGRSEDGTGIGDQSSVRASPLSSFHPITATLSSSSSSDNPSAVKPNTSSYGGHGEGSTLQAWSTGEAAALGGISSSGATGDRGTKGGSSNQREIDSTPTAAMETATTGDRSSATDDVQSNSNTTVAATAAANATSQQGEAGGGGVGGGVGGGGGRGEAVGVNGGNRSNAVTTTPLPSVVNATGNATDRRTMLMTRCYECHSKECNNLTTSKVCLSSTGNCYAFYDVEVTAVTLSCSPQLPFVAQSCNGDYLYAASFCQFCCRGLDYCNNHQTLKYSLEDWCSTAKITTSDVMATSLVAMAAVLIFCINSF